MKRRTARENAMLCAFSATFDANSLDEIIVDSREDGGEYAVDSYGEALLINYFAHKGEVDECITAKLKDWTLARLPRVNAAILRIAVTEMIYSAEDIDSIVINEAVEIAKKYAGEDDYQFINGVLGSISRERSGGGAKEETFEYEPDRSAEIIGEDLAAIEIAEEAPAVAEESDEIGILEEFSTSSVKICTSEPEAGE